MSRHLRVIAYLAWLSLFLFGPDLAIAQFGPPPRDQGFAVFYSPGVRVDAGRSLLYNFYVATYLRRARLAGNITAQGGSGNDIRSLSPETSASFTTRDSVGPWC